MLKNKVKRLLNKVFNKSKFEDCYQDMWLKNKAACGVCAGNSENERCDVCPFANR